MVLILLILLIVANRVFDGPTPHLETSVLGVSNLATHEAFNYILFCALAGFMADFVTLETELGITVE